jgi:hypothetical protein
VEDRAPIRTQKEKVAAKEGPEDIKQFGKEESAGPIGMGAAVTPGHRGPLLERPLPPARHLELVHASMKAENVALPPPQVQRRRQGPEPPDLPEISGVNELRLKEVPATVGYP